MVTALEAVADTPRTYLVQVIRQPGGAPREGDDHSVLFRDPNVKLEQWANDNGNPVRYRFTFLGSSQDPDAPPFRFQRFWVAVYYRRHEGKYPNRAFKTVFQDQYVRLLKFGNKDPDYMFVTTCPPADDRAGDKRFSTVADTHPVELDPGEVSMVMPDDEVSDG